MLKAFRHVDHTLVHGVIDIQNVGEFQHDGVIVPGTGGQHSARKNQAE
jgi:hypothetical protein